MRKRASYSLHQLLVVISLLFLLLLLAFPLISSVREGVRIKTCLSNTKMVGNAMNLYIHDFDDTYPPPITGVFETVEGGKAHSEGGIPWSQLLTPYVKTLGKQFPHCPSVDIKFIAEEIFEQNLCGFAYNANLSEGVLIDASKSDILIGKLENSVEYSGLTVMFCDARLGISAVKKPDVFTPGKVYGICVTGLKPYVLTQPAGATRHRGGGNYTFADSHVKWFKPEKLSTDAKCDGRTPGFGL